VSLTDAEGFDQLTRGCLKKHTNCCFYKHGLVLIIFGQQHQHTFKNDMHIQLSVSHHFYLLYLLLRSCDGNDAKQRVFLGRLLVALQRAGCVVCWL